MSSEREPACETAVLIVGGGPAGVVSALCLAARGIPSIVVERRQRVDGHPKAHELNTRSIEILHDLGVTSEELEAEASPEKDGSRILFCRTINQEFGRIDLGTEEASAHKYREHLRAPRPYLNLSQTEFEKVLARHAEKEPLVDVRRGVEWEGMRETEGGLVSTVRDVRRDSSDEIRSRYVLGCDGAGSPVRKALGIGMDGPPKLQDFLNVYFEHNLRDRLETPAKLYWILHPEASGAFIAHHVERRWTYNMPLTSPWETRDDWDENKLRDRIHTALGFDAGIEIRSVSSWRMTVQVAERYRQGRVFLVGDSAHRFPPTGGLGMNTGIADAHNLAWKVAAVLEGTAEDWLLDSYETERRPVAVRNAEESLANFHKIFEVVEALGLKPSGAELLARLRSPRALRWIPRSLKRGLVRVAVKLAERALGRFQDDAALRGRVQRAIQDQTAHFDRIGLDVGYVYEEGALVPDGARSTAQHSVTEYAPTTDPGARFPHVALDGEVGGRSSLDLVDYRRWTLLGAAGAERWREAARALGGELETSVEYLGLDEVDAVAGARSRLTEICDLGEQGAVLIRPDGHVAWRTRSEGNVSDLRRVAEALGLR